jgi:hypothetical protein
MRFRSHLLAEIIINKWQVCLIRQKNDKIGDKSGDKTGDKSYLGGDKQGANKDSLGANRYKWKVNGCLINHQRDGL